MMSKPSFALAVVIVAAILAYWHGSPIRPEYRDISCMVTAVFMIVAMWIFPEAGGKNARPSQTRIWRPGHSAGFPRIVFA